MRFAVLVASLALLTATTGTPAPINTDDYFQVPADLFEHGHSLARHSEQIRSYKELTHRVKTADGWKTSSEARLVSIDHKLVSDSFFYHSSTSGAVTNITSVFETVSDTVYFDQIPSVAAVSCNGDFIAVEFDTSALDRSAKNGLTFGSKCAHYAPGVRVTGGNAIFCSTPSDPAAPVFRQVASVLSCVEDPASGRVSSVKLGTTIANPISFYSSVSDYSINGSMVLVPKRLFRPNSKVDFFELSRQLWKERQTGPHLRGACQGVISGDGSCHDVDYFPSFRPGMVVQKSAFSLFAFFVLLHNNHAFVALFSFISSSLHADVCFVAIEAFNYNYDKANNKATENYIPLFGEGATSGGLPTGFAVGCVDCYAYAGITLTFRQVEALICVLSYMHCASIFFFSVTYFLLILFAAGPRFMLVRLASRFCTFSYRLTDFLPASSRYKHKRPPLLLVRRLKHLE